MGLAIFTKRSSTPAPTPLEKDFVGFEMHI
jgi:hypothetical protein